MFKVIPSLSVSNGQVVKTKKGDVANLLKYNYSPVDAARLFEDHGMEVLHFVDLDAKEKGSPVNYHVLEAIAGHTSLKVDFLGGIRTDGDINKVMEYGATYFTCASISVNNQELFTSWIFSYGREKLSLSADMIDGKVMIDAWRKKTEIDVYDHIDYFYQSGLKYVKITDVTRDGCLDGPNFSMYKKSVEKFPHASIAAIGGVRSTEDIQKLKDMGVYAVIIGRALYEDRIKLKDIEKFNMANS